MKITRKQAYRLMAVLGVLIAAAGGGILLALGHVADTTTILA